MATVEGSMADTRRHVQARVMAILAHMRSAGAHALAHDIEQGALALAAGTLSREAYRVQFSQLVQQFQTGAWTKSPSAPLPPPPGGQEGGGQGAPVSKKRSRAKQSKVSAPPSAPPPPPSGGAGEGVEKAALVPPSPPPAAGMRGEWGFTLDTGTVWQAKFDYLPANVRQLLADATTRYMSELVQTRLIGPFMRMQRGTPGDVDALYRQLAGREEAAAAAVAGPRPALPIHVQTAVDAANRASEVMARSAPKSSSMLVKRAAEAREKHQQSKRVKSIGLAFALPLMAPCMTAAARARVQMGLL